MSNKQMLNLDFLEREACLYKNAKNQITDNSKILRKTVEENTKQEMAEVENILMEHLVNLHQFYGQIMGVRIARKHVAWYLQTHDKEGQFRRVFNALETAQEQVSALNNYFQAI